MTGFGRLLVMSILVLLLFKFTEKIIAENTYAKSSVLVERTTLNSRSENVLTAIALSNDGKIIASTSNWGNTVTVWDRSWKMMLKINNLQGPFIANSLAFADHGRLLITGPDHNSPDRTAVSVWNVADGRKIIDLPAFGGPGHISSFSESPDGKYLAIIFAAYKSVVLYDVRSWKVVGELGTSNSLPCQVAFDSTGTKIAIATYSGNIAIGEIFASDAAINFRPFGLHDNSVIGPIAFSPDGQSLLVTASITVTAIDHPVPVQIFSAVNGQKTREFQLVDRPVRGAAWLSKENIVLVVDNSSKLHVWPEGGAGKETMVKLFGTDEGPLSPDPAGDGFAYGSGREIATFRVHAKPE